MMEVGRLGGKFKGFWFCVREGQFLAVTLGALNSYRIQIQIRKVWIWMPTLPGFDGGTNPGG